MSKGKSETERGGKRGRKEGERQSRVQSGVLVYLLKIMVLFDMKSLYTFFCLTLLIRSRLLGPTHSQEEEIKN